MTIRRSALVALMTIAAALFAVSAAQAATIRLQSTTDIRDSGQYADVFVPGYAAAQPGDTLNGTFVGTGAALDNARAGLADVVITHAPSLEAGFVNAVPSYSEESHGRSIFYNDYVIVGPKTDPANVSGLARHDAVLALQTIAARGASNSDVTFVSRGDNSGTNVQEQILWGLSSVTPKKLACNGAGDPARYEPGTACPGGYPGWYKQSGLGQGPNLTSANTCSTSLYPNSGCYTMLDKGTWIKNQTAASNMKIVSDANSAGAIGGQTLQTNYFHAYVVSDGPAPYPNGTTPDVAAGQRFVNYLVSPSAQSAIGIYPTAANPAGTPDAVPEASYTAPSNAPSGSSITITATLKYAAPPKPVLPSVPNVQLQQSVGGGAYTDIAGKVGTTNASGVVTFTGVTITATTKYRVRMPQYDNSSANIFTLFTAGPALQSKTVNVP